MHISSTFPELTPINDQEAQQLLKQSEERFRSLVANIPGAVYRCAYDRTIPLRTMVFLTEAIQDISGYPPTDFINNRIRSFASIIHPHDQERLDQAVRQSVIAKQPYAIEYRIVRADGSLAWVYDKGQCIFSKNEERQPQNLLLHIDGVILDITERKQAEADVPCTQVFLHSEVPHESEALYHHMIETASEGVWMFDVNSKTTFVNTRMAQMLGYTVEEMLGRSLFDFIDEESRVLAQAYVERRRQGIQQRHDFKFRRKDGSDLWAIVSATPILDAASQFIGVLRMITDNSDHKQAEEALRQSERQLRFKNQQLEQTLHQLRQTQAQLIQNEKMVSLGQLIAGIAHEINNPVSFIYGNINYAREYAFELLHLVQLYIKHYPEPVPEIQDQIEAINLDFLTVDFPRLLESMNKGANRIRKIVLSLRNFSRLDEAERKQVNIHEGIDSALFILQHRLKQQPSHPEIQVCKDYGQLPLVECYPSQLNQVFMHLLNNALDALEEQGSREDALIQNPQIWICTEVQDNNRVVIRIADNGPGIPADVKKRIFDPFFTTKPVGASTGLGLSISHSIVVEKHGGQLTCISTLGQGAEFVIELPVQQKLS